MMYSPTCVAFLPRQAAWKKHKASRYAVQECRMTSDQGRVLVVDDHKPNRIKISFAVKKLGHIVEAAEDGRQALEMLREQPFDLVLLDILMPELDGYQVLERMKADS